MASRENAFLRISPETEVFPETSLAPIAMVNGISLIHQEIWPDELTSWMKKYINSIRVEKKVKIHLA